VKIGLISLGCAKNLVDSEMMLGQLKKAQYELTTNLALADLIIINTCGFILSAKEEAIRTIFEVASKKESWQKLVVTGCLVQRYLDDLIYEIPEVDAFITIDDYQHFNEIISDLMIDKPTNSGGLDFNCRVLATPPFTAYVRIADGCDNRCAYCAIPLIRGPFKSRKIKDIVFECQNLLKNGVKELVLIAQDTTRFGKDNNETLEDLLEEVLALKDLKLLRLLYLYPDEISERLLNIFQNNPKMAAYFDLPIQHASDRILKAMNRRGSQEDIRRLIGKIRQKVPKVIVRSTVMVGFPGEEKEDYQILEDFIKEIEFERLGVFIYSAEEDTKAFTLPKQVREEEKKRRYQKLIEVQQKIARKKNQARIGEITMAFVESYDARRKKYRLRDYSFAGDDVDGYIYVESKDKLTIGAEVKVEIIASYTYDLLGRLIK
jgi:ribosomal protein S12 methylthiotransferase